MYTMRFVSATCLLIAIVSVSLASPGCYPCKFKFCDGKYIYELGQNGGATFSGPLCYHGKRVGLVYTGEARFLESDSDLTKISEYEFNGGTKFCPTFFRGFIYQKHSPLRSGIGHEALKDNQEEVIKNAKCVVLPISAAQILGNGRVVREYYFGENGDVDNGNCIAFKFK